jgi:hypothetical protein
LVKNVLPEKRGESLVDLLTLISYPASGGPVALAYKKLSNGGFMVALR